MITKTKDRISIILSGKLQYLNEKLVYIHFYNNQVAYFINNPYYQDIQIGDEYVSFLLKKQPESVIKYIVCICNEYGKDFIEKAIRALYVLNCQGVIEMSFDNIKSKKDIIEFAGYSIIQAKENNILKIQEECLLIESFNKKNRCYVKNIERSDVFDGHFMRKEIFSFRYDYFIFLKENEKSVIVVENRSDGNCVIRYLNAPKTKLAELLETFVFVEFEFNGFCNQIKIELSDLYMYENSIIERINYFRRYMEMIDGRDEHIVYGYQVLRRIFQNDR